MEEVEKRRERLRAMRMQADQAMSSHDTEHFPGIPPSLVNPFDESSACLASSSAAARFDYYTDPTAAFYHTPPRPEVHTTPTPAYRGNNYSQGSRNYDNSHFSTPTQTTRPFGMPRVNYPGFFSGSNDYRPSRSMYQAPDINGGPAMGRPMQTGSSFGTPLMNFPGSSGPDINGGPAMLRPMQTGSSFGTPPMNYPGVFNGSRGSPNQYIPSSLTGATNFRSPQRGGNPSFNYGRGREQRFIGSPSLGSGCGGRPFKAGRGRNNSFRPPFVRGGRGRSGSHNNISAELRPDLFYHKSMVEDPWKMLNR